MKANLNPTLKSVTNEVIDLDLSVTKKKKFRFDKDDKRILELNVSDMNILGRISETYPKLNELNEKAGKLMEGIEIEEEDIESSMASAGTIAERLKAVDTEMRELIDYMFNAEVSSVAAPDGSMYDPFQGSFRYEHIIALLISQYENNLQSEFNKMEKQLKKHTAKYKKG